MKRLITALLFASLSLAAVDASADRRGPRKPPVKPKREVPELSIAGAGSAAFLLIGAALVMAGRRRRQEAR